MLGWALKKGFQGATGLRDAPECGDDTTQLDVPDTPAPVFAARAIKNAIWGESMPEANPPAKMKSSEKGPTTHTQEDAGGAVPIDTRSPAKLNSILLTPGTGTSRRKRVSFGRDVKAANTDLSPLSASSSRNGRRRKTTLQQALENSRPAKSRAREPAVEETEPDNTDEEWEDEDNCCQHDLTVDLNEPHSESGKYWKAEWARYREEAKLDIEQLVKYKANAKSFAAKKDNEASQLSQKLKDEQAKVAELEKKMADMSSKLAAAKQRGSDKEHGLLSKDMAEQDSLIAEYRDRVRDLEARLKDATTNNARSDRASRELRKARSELKDMDRLREEVKRLKSNLATSRERVAELEIQTSSSEMSESTRVSRLEKQLRHAKEETLLKEAEIRDLKEEYESLKRNAKSRTAEAMEVLQRKNGKIAELEKKLKDAEAANGSNRLNGFNATLEQQNTITRDLKSNIASLGQPSRYEMIQPTNRLGRALSMDDMTLDMTQRSLLTDNIDDTPLTKRQERGYGADMLDDWTADIPAIDLRARERTTRPREATNGEERHISENVDSQTPRRASRRTESRPLANTGRVVTDVLTDRVNESSGTAVRRHVQSRIVDEPPASNNQNLTDQRANTQTSIIQDRTDMHGASERSSRRPRTLSRATRTLSSNNDAPTIDLVQDRYTQLGAPPTDNTTSGNTSRCALPADRLAAARARLAKKKMEKGKAGGHDLNKENVRP
ncbi:hypothetical protein GGS20DRAFT_298548 [Poronia punctata]|nr:hypothetical protein GGS20DRAFT_298548 [Poronia punctata]